MEHVGVEVEESAERPVRARELSLDAGFVEFAVAGTSVAGEFRCAECGYGAVVQHSLPQCPMCGGSVWESRGPLPSKLAD